MGADVTLLSSLTLSKRKGQRRRRAREPERQLPRAAGLQEPRRRLCAVGVPSAVQQHDQLRLGAAVRPRQALGQRHLAGPGPARRRLADRRHQHDHAGRDGHVPVHAGAGVPGVGDHQRFLGREQLPAEHHLRSVRGRWPAVDHQLVQPGVRRRCRPIRASRSATRRATTSAGRTSGRSISRPPSRCRSVDRVRMQLRIEAFNLFNRVNFTAPAANRSNSTFGTITSTYDARQVQLGIEGDLVIARKNVAARSPHRPRFVMRASYRRNHRRIDGSDDCDARIFSAVPPCLGECRKPCPAL